MKVTVPAGLGAAWARPRRTVAPWRVQRRGVAYATAPSAYAHQGARRAARPGRGIGCVPSLMRRSHGEHREEQHGLLPRPRPRRGGPALLTEDRQKPRRLLDGMHGTRNTVPAIAVLASKRCIPLRPWNYPHICRYEVAPMVRGAAAIDRARILRGWTRRELGRHAHVDEGALCDLFAGRRRPTLGTLRALCSSLEFALSEVIKFA